MPNYAVVSGNSIINTIVAESLEIAQEVSKSACIEITSEVPLGIGWIYSEEHSEWYQPLSELAIDIENY